MAAIDRNVLRLAAFELLNELGHARVGGDRRGGGDRQNLFDAGFGKFVNGILDKIKAERPAALPAAAA